MQLFDQVLPGLKIDTTGPGTNNHVVQIASVLKNNLADSILPVLHQMRYSNEEINTVKFLLQLSQIGLQFDESKSDNPFAYYTAAITNSFTRILNIEKKNQNIRDDLLELAQMKPSSTRQNQELTNTPHNFKK